MPHNVPLMVSKYTPVGGFGEMDQDVAFPVVSLKSISVIDWFTMISIWE